MKTLKNLIILSCFLLSALFYVSCSKDKTGTEITLSYYAGNWYKDGDTNPYIIINSDGSLTIKDKSDDKREASTITRNSAISYTLHDGATLNFSSLIKGKFTPQGIDSVEITKK